MTHKLDPDALSDLYEAVRCAIEMIQTEHFGRPTDAEVEECLDKLYDAKRKAEGKVKV